MRRHFAAFAGAAAVTPEPAPTAVPRVPHGGNSLGNTTGHPQTPVSQGFRDAVPHVPLVPRENDRSQVELSFEREERAAVLEFDEGLSRAEAEVLAGADLSAPDISPAIKPARATVAHAPAIEVPYVEYDRQADTLIAAAITAGRDPGELQRRKSKGHVIERGDDWIFVRGRW